MPVGMCRREMSCRGSARKRTVQPRTRGAPVFLSTNLPAPKWSDANLLRQGGRRIALELNPTKERDSNPPAEKHPFPLDVATTATTSPRTHSEEARIKRIDSRSRFVPAAMVMVIHTLACGGETSGHRGSETGSAASGGATSGASGASGVSGSSGTGGDSGANGAGASGAGGVSGQGGTAGNDPFAVPHTKCLGFVEQAPYWPAWYYNSQCSGDPARRCPGAKICCQNVCYTYCEVNRFEGSDTYGQCGYYLECTTPDLCLPEGVVPWLGDTAPP